LLVAVAEMALAGGCGAALEAPPAHLPAHAVWFGEDQGRYVVAAAADEAARIVQEAAKAGIPARTIGTAGGDALKLAGEAPLLLSSLRTAHERWLPAFMGGS
jgi:phosphoribosylformylglycinamidine synthase